MKDEQPASDDAFPRDPWLREALRHAPDAEAAPPRAVSDAILRQAHASAPRRPRSTVGSWIDRSWAWLARPQSAAAVAAIFAATVLALMFGSGALEDKVRQQPEAAVELAHAPAPAEAPEPIRAQRDARRESAQLAPAAPAPPVAADRALQPAPAARTARARADTAADPLMSAASQIAARADALRWTIGTRTHAHGVDQQAWFDELRAATADRWQPSIASGEPLQGVRLRLTADSAPLADVVLADHGIEWRSAGATWFAPLPQPIAARLREIAQRW